jgi:hypothetical protein
MEESLKYARLINRLVIIASTSMCLFAFSPKTTESDYELALREAQLLLPTFEYIVDKEGNFLRNYYDRKGVPALIGEIFVGLVDSPPRMDTRYHGGLWSAPLWQVHYNLHKQYGDWSFVGTWVHDFDPDILKAKLVAFSKEYSEHLAAFEYYRISTSASYPAITFYKAFESTAFPIEFKEDELRERGNILGERFAYRYVYANGLISNENGNIVTLPALKKVWALVKDLDIESAVDILREKSREAEMQSRGTLSLLGFSVGSRIASFVGPIIVTGLLLYLLTHVIHLIALKDDNPELLRTFPWICLFPNWLGRLLAFFSLIGFPLIASIWIVQVSSYPEIYIWILSGIYVLLVGTIGGAIFHKTNKLIYEVRH